MRFGFSTLFVLMVASPGFAAEPQGTVVLHGGGSVDSAVRDKFLELAGGKNARLLVIPTADTDTPYDDGRLEIWRRRSPASVALLHASTHTEAEREAFAEPLKTATGVWISGGYQSKLASVYLRTPVERELAALLKRGGVIGGTSAGAAIQSRVMLTRGDMLEGFDHVPATIVDQHFLARNRQERLWHALARHPKYIGIGIDEDTTAIITGNRLTVMGESTVSICSAPRQGDRKLRQLKDGEQLDLSTLRMELTGNEANAE